MTLQVDEYVDLFVDGRLSPLFDYAELVGSRLRAAMEHRSVREHDMAYAWASRNAATALLNIYALEMQAGKESPTEYYSYVYDCAVVVNAAAWVAEGETPPLTASEQAFVQDSQDRVYMDLAARAHEWLEVAWPHLDEAEKAAEAEFEAYMAAREKGEVADIA